MKSQMLHTDKHKESFIQSLSSLFFSWGGDTPPEVYWGCNDLLDWYEKTFTISLGIRFEEPQESNNYENNYKAVIEAIKKS